ncbi:hypothetical protein HDV03_000176 [Kappamyces sp. JEL0829]|nr:hypothetical protein HDV03_000176 [Kappamyces sp. JEL0829]
MRYPLLLSRLHPARRLQSFPAAWIYTSSGNSFDTYKFIQRLELDGFPRDKAEAIMNSLTELVSESGSNLAKSSVTKSDFERAMYQARVDLAHLRSEVSLLEKNEFTLLKAEVGRLKGESSKIPNRITEECKRVQANVRVELSVDKSRIRDEQAHQELKIKEAISKIDTEVGNFRTAMETIQWQPDRLCQMSTKILEKLRQNILDGNYYEAHQMYHSISGRLSKQKKWKEARAIQMLKARQEESALDLCSKLIDLVDAQAQAEGQTLVVEANRETLMEIFDYFPLKTAQCDQFIQLVLKWSAKHLKLAAGDSILHHVFGARCYQESRIFDAEYHFFHGTQESIKLLAHLEAEVANSAESSFTQDKGYYIARAVLPLLILGKVGDALSCFDQFTLLLPPSDFQESPQPGLAKLSVHPLYNFTLLLLQIVEKGAGEHFVTLVNHHQDDLALDTYLLECATKIGQLYFRIGVEEKPVNPFAGLFKQMLQGPPEANQLTIADDMDYD